MLMCAYFSDLLKTHLVVQIFHSRFGSFFCASLMYTCTYIYINIYIYIYTYIYIYIYIYKYKQVLILVLIPCKEPFHWLLLQNERWYRLKLS